MQVFLFAFSNINIKSFFGYPIYFLLKNIVLSIKCLTHQSKTYYRLQKVIEDNLIIYLSPNENQNIFLFI